MKALIVGADGDIGSALARALSNRGDEVYGTTRRTEASTSTNIYFDLADSDPNNAVLPPVDVAVFCAAIASFAECRRNRDQAHRVNVSAPVALARRLTAAGAHVVLLSTGAVFDWSTPYVRADSPPRPVTVYGALKAEAEKEFLALGNAASVVRFSKVLTPQFKLCVGWINTLQSGAPINAFSDLRMSPIGLGDAVEAIMSVIDDGSGGIFQLTGSRDISYFDTGLHLAQRLGVPAERVQKASAIAAGIPPEEITWFSSLDDSRLRTLTGRKAPDPELVLDAVFGPVISAATAKTS
jgi:dTDP-4-dehydrorhamnose reductase